MTGLLQVLVSPAPEARTRIRVSTLSLVGLLLFIGVGSQVDEGFTRYWGYLLVQVACTLAFLLVAEAVFASRGGLSPVTHGIAIAVSFADVLGTEGRLYASIDEYDKFTHFLGTAAIAAGAYDLLRALRWPRSVDPAPAQRVWLAMAIAVTAGIGWEVYEFLGDKVFQTARAQGQWDTLNDVVSDTLGAATVVFVLWAQERGAGARPAEDAPSTTGPG